MNINVLEYNTAKELNELFKSKVELEKADILYFELKNENKKEIVFEYTEFWKAKKREGVIFLILLSVIILFYFIIEPILNFISQIFNGLSEEMVKPIVAVPIIAMLFKTYQLLSFKRKLKLKKNKVTSNILDKNFEFSSIELGKANGIIYASFMTKNTPVSDGLIFFETQFSKGIDLIEIIRTYSKKFKIELKEKNIE